MKKNIDCTLVRNPDLCIHKIHIDTMLRALSSVPLFFTTEIIEPSLFLNPKLKVSNNPL